MSEVSRVTSTSQDGAELDYLGILRGVLKRRKILVIATFILVALPLVAWKKFGQRPRFQSTATIHIRPSIADMLPGTRDLPVGPNLAVQMAVLESRMLAEEVIDAVPQETVDELIRENMKPDYFLVISNAVRQLLGKQPVTISPRERALAELRQSRMNFGPVSTDRRRDQSGIIRVWAVAFRPLVARDLVNAYVRVLINWTRRTEQEDVTATRRFLELQLNRVQKDLRESEAALARFEERHGVVRLTDQAQFEMSRLVQLQGELAQIQANHEVAQSRLRALQKALKQAPESLSVPSDTQITAEAVQTLSARLVELEANLVQMRARYTEEHPALIAAREEIHNLRTQLAQLPIGEAGARGDTAPMSREEILRGIASAKADLSQLQTQEQSLRLQIGQFRTSLQRLSGRESDYSRLRGSVGSNQALVSFLLDRLFALQVREQSQGSIVQTIDPPTLPSSPVEAVTFRELAVLVVFALATAGGMGLLVEYLYQPVETEQAVRRHLDLPFLGSALVVSGSASKESDSPLIVFGEGRRATIPQELYRGIRANLEAANHGVPFKAIMITSPLPDEGKSTTAVNLALTLRELGRRVVLVDADLRRPSLNKVFQPQAQDSLVDILRRSRESVNAMFPTVDSPEVRAASPESNFLFIPSGDTPAEDPAALLTSERAREFITWLKRQWDYILFDSPPLLLASENVLLAKALDGVLLVAHSGHTKMSDLRRARDLLEDAGVRILGVVLNRVSLKEMPYYYHRYRGYYAPHVKQK